MNVTCFLLFLKRAWRQFGFVCMFSFLSKVSPEAAQQRQALQMFQLLPCLLRLCLASNTLVCTCHKKRQGLLLQHVRQVVHLCEFETRVIFLSLNYKGQRSHLKSFPLLLLRRPTLWNTCLNMQWWNTWCLITPLITGQTLPPSLYGSPSSEPLTRLLPSCFLWHRHFGPLMNHTARYWDPKTCQIASILWRGALLLSISSCPSLLTR